MPSGVTRSAEEVLGPYLCFVPEQGAWRPVVEFHTSTAANTARRGIERVVGYDRYLFDVVFVVS
jgi:hypothetical protein